MTFIITRLFWLTSAFFNIVLGIIGLALPVMPASPFFILALISVKKLHLKLTNVSLRPDHLSGCKANFQLWGNG